MFLKHVDINSASSDRIIAAYVVRPVLSIIHSFTENSLKSWEGVYKQDLNIFYIVNNMQIF